MLVLWGAKGSELNSDVEAGHVLSHPMRVLAVGGVLHHFQPDNPVTPNGRRTGRAKTQALRQVGHSDAVAAEAMSAIAPRLGLGRARESLDQGDRRQLRHGAGLRGLGRPPVGIRQAAPVCRGQAPPSRHRSRPPVVGRPLRASSAAVPLPPRGRVIWPRAKPAERRSA